MAARLAQRDDVTASARDTRAAPDPAPRASFTRGIFAGVVHDGLLFPFPDSLDVRDPDEARTVRKLIERLEELRGDLIDSEKFDEAETIGDDVVAALAESGFLALTIPREYGGLGLSATGYARVFEAISVADASVAVLVGVHCGLGSKAIALYGTDEQKRRYLPALARGETLAAYALTEPEIGSDAQHIRSAARLSPDGSEWVLDGHKIWIGNAHRAGVIVTFAQTPVRRKGLTEQRPTAFIIRPDMPGFKVLGTVRKLGVRGSTQAELLYEKLRVPADHVLGGVGRGFSVAVHVLNAGRLTLLAGCTGGAKSALGEMARYAEQREQFGHPLAHFEITQRKMSQLASEIYAADAMLGILTSLADRADSDPSLESACAKVFASDMVWRATDELVQVAGGRGYVKPFPYERMLRDSRINRIFEGANEVLRLFIALNGVEGPAGQLKELGSALRRPMRNLGLLGGYAAARVRGALGGTPTLDVEIHPRLAEHKRYFEKHVAELKGAAERAIMRHKAELLDRQLVLERLANMAIELFATAAVISRTHRLLSDGEEAAHADALALCDLFCVLSGRRFRAARNALDNSEDGVDDARRRAAAAVRAAEGYFVSDAVLELD
jgi:alkylation response protein AidB-like acyl-CoA dehydrogenase